MKYRSCVIVLIGTDTWQRPWVKYEIKKAWNDGRGLYGVRIHNLKDPNKGTCALGINPFSQFAFKGKDGTPLTIPVYNPNSSDAYGDIKRNLDKWSDDAVAQNGDRTPLA